MYRHSSLINLLFVFFFHSPASNALENNFVELNVSRPSGENHTQTQIESESESEREWERINASKIRGRCIGPGRLSWVETSKRIPYSSRWLSSCRRTSYTIPFAYIHLRRRNKNNSFSIGRISFLDKNRFSFIRRAHRIWRRVLLWVSARARLRIDHYKTKLVSAYISLPERDKRRKKKNSRSEFLLALSRRLFTPKLKNDLSQINIWSKLHFDDIANDACVYPACHGP